MEENNVARTGREVPYFEPCRSKLRRDMLIIPARIEAMKMGTNEKCGFSRELSVQCAETFAHLDTHCSTVLPLAYEKQRSDSFAVKLAVSHDRRNCRCGLWMQNPDNSQWCTNTKVYYNFLNIYSFYLSIIRCIVNVTHRPTELAVGA